ncbi:MAG: flavodoxin family protein [Desulfovibrio sp.]|jgi:multimeric flavodoxin WrbA|nr:flavodoxin family protein [Desulfovibrio sp.]
MSSHILILSGSPRKNGNTERLVTSFADGATAIGKTAKIIRVAGLKISGCRGCEYCFAHNGVCVQNDDMPPILDELQRVDALVLASPVYFFGVTAQLKLVIDRFFALLQKGMAVKRAALLMTCGNTSDAAAAASIAMFRQISAYQKWKEAGIIVAPGLHNPGEIEGRPELEQAKRLGESI